MFAMIMVESVKTWAKKNIRTYVTQHMDAESLNSTLFPELKIELELTFKKTQELDIELV